MKLREAEKANVDTISTGSLTVDLALGVNGIPRGRITEYMVERALVKQRLL
jgi:recombination protein RecA